MDDELDHGELAKDLLGQVDRIDSRLGEVKSEREKLFEANNELVQLVEELENELEGFIQESDTDADSADISVDGYQYSYQDGWKEKGEHHKDRLDLDADDGDVKLSAVDDQIKEVRESIRRLKRLHQQHMDA